MARKILSLLLAGCWGICLWGQTPQAQLAQPSAAEQKAVDQNHLPEQTPPAPSASETESSQYPLDRFENFSAIQNGGPLPGMDADRYIYRSGKMMRMQGDASPPNYYVTDLSKQESHMVAASGCLQLGSAYTRSFPFFLSGPGVTYEHIPGGEATVDGHRCHVEEVKIHSPKNPVVIHFRLYEADDLEGFPIKIENRREPAYPWVIHYKDVRLGPQDPSLFLYPQQCQSSLGFKKISPGSKAKAAQPAKPQ
jgi:hypothetical protein